MARIVILDRIPGAPWRPWEVAGILLGLAIAWPLAAAYVGWRLWTATRQPSADQAAGRESPFDAYKRATLERHAAEQRKLQDEERDFAETVRELRRPRAPEEFERFAGGRRASA